MRRANSASGSLAASAWPMPKVWLGKLADVGL
jgi:hypothetical protein